MLRGAVEGMRACHSKVVGDRIRRSKQDSGDKAAHAGSMAAFRLLEEGHSLHPRIRTSIHESTRLQRAALHNGLAWNQKLQSDSSHKNVRRGSVTPLWDGKRKRQERRVNAKIRGSCGHGGAGVLRPYRHRDRRRETELRMKIVRRRKEGT